MTVQCGDDRVTIDDSSFDTSKHNIASDSAHDRNVLIIECRMRKTQQGRDVVICGLLSVDNDDDDDEEEEEQE
jgi:hypothetical protein